MSYAPGIGLGSRGPAKNTFGLPGLSYYVSGSVAPTTVQGLSGTGDSLGPPLSTISNVLDDAAGNFLSVTMTGAFIRIQGATTPAYNGDWYIQPGGGGFTAPTNTNMSITKANGSTFSGPMEAYTGNWNISPRVSQTLDLTSNAAFTQATPGNSPAHIPHISAVNALAFSAATNSNCVLLRDDATLGASFSGATVSFCFRVWVFTFFSGQDVGGIANAANTNFIYPGYNVGSQFRVRWGAGAVTTLTVNGGAFSTGAWMTLGYRLNFSANTFTAYKNGTLIGTSAAGTARNPTGMSQFRIGNGSFSTGFMLSAFMWAAANWSDADFLAAHNQIVSLVP